MGLQFTVCWAIDGEACPTLDYLVSLWTEDRDCFYAVLDGIEKIQDSRYLCEPTVKRFPVNKKVTDLFELRVQGGKRRARIALLYTKAHEIILLNGVTKKSQKATKQFIGKAVTLRMQIRSEEIDYEPIPIDYIKQELERQS
ncbi:MAG TPA: type II toxin-antitoxin system RelE/ParE family toxin [Candidatus Saccharimonadales bacterium]